MAARRRKNRYPKPIIEHVEKVTGWIHLCGYCGEEFSAKKKVGPKYCPFPKQCRQKAGRTKE